MPQGLPDIFLHGCLSMIKKKKRGYTPEKRVALGRRLMADSNEHDVRLPVECTEAHKILAHGENIQLISA